LQCSTCNDSDVRFSRFRLVDTLPLVLMLFPIRCRACYKRSYISVPKALKMRSRSRRRKCGHSLFAYRFRATSQESEE
jgi:hypothetical protein